MFNQQLLDELTVWADEFGMTMDVTEGTAILVGKAGETVIEADKGVVKAPNKAIRAKAELIFKQFTKPALCENPSAYDEAEAPPADVEDKLPGEHSEEVVSELKRIFDNDLMEIFGKSGSCKSKLMEEVARSAQRLGLKVYYVDTERNLSRGFIKTLGPNYIYNPRFDEVKKILARLPKADILLVDSIGLPALTKFAKLGRSGGAGEKGEIFLDMEAMYGDMKNWCFDNDGLAIVSNQPKSEFSKTEEQRARLEPFGDKCRHQVKNVLRLTKKKSPGEGVTHVDITSHRTRDFADDEVLGSVTVSDLGTKVRFAV